MGFTFSQTGGTSGITTITTSATPRQELTNLSKNYILANTNGSSLNMSLVQLAYEPIAKYITISPSAMTWASSGATDSVTINSNDDWVLVSDGWIQLSRLAVIKSGDYDERVNAISGNGNTIVGIYCSENTGNTRTGGITAYCQSDSSITATTTVSQTGYYQKPYIYLNTYVMEIGSSGALTSVTVSSNTNWNVMTDSRWITLNTFSGTGNGSVSFLVDEHTDSIERRGTITVFNGDVSATLVISQEATKPYIIVSPDTFTVPASGSTNTISVSANCDYDITADVGWITLGASSGSGNGSVSFTTTSKVGDRGDVGNIEFSNTGLSRTVSVTRQGVELYLSASTSSITGSSTGDTFEVFVYSNVNWTVSVDTQEETLSTPWLSATPLSGSNDGSIRISIESGTTEKTGTIILYSSKYGLSWTIDILRNEPVSGRKIYYKTNDGQVAEGSFYRENWGGANIISNTYENGQGILEFDDDVTIIPMVRPYHIVGETVIYARYTEFTIPNTVTTLNLSFNNALESGVTITIPNSVTTIIGGFGFNSGITVNIPKNVSLLSGSTFSGDTDITVIYNAQNCTVGTSSSFNNHYPFEGATGRLIIGEDVERINDNTFKCCGLGGDLFIPNNVTYLGNAAFSGATGFTSVRLPENITTIGEECFNECTGITGTLRIPSNITSIGQSAFRMTSITGLEGLRSGLTLNSDCFRSCSGLTGHLTVPSGLEFAGVSIFNYTSYTGVTVEDGVIYSYPSEYGGYYLSGIDTLKVAYVHTVNIPTGFMRNCSNLKDIYLYSAATIGAYSFNGSIADIHSYTQTGATFGYVGDSASTTSYPFRAMSGYTGYIYIPLGGDYAKWKIANRSNVAYCFYIDGDTTKLLYKSGTAQAPNVSSGWGATITGNRAVNGIGTITFNGSPNAVPNNAFSGKSISSFVLPNTIVTIGDNAFKNTTLINIILGDSITTIGNGAFSGIKKTVMDIPDTVTSIGDEAFQSCTALTTVYIGSSVQTIGWAAFNGCPISTVYSYNEIPPDLGEDPQWLFSDQYGVTIHYPSSADYSYWRNIFTGSTFVGDL